MFPFWLSAPTDVTLVSPHETAQPCWDIPLSPANSVVSLRDVLKKFMDPTSAPSRSTELKSSDITSLRVRSYVVYPVHRKFLKLYQQWIIYVILLCKHLQDYVRRVDVSTSTTFLPDLQVRCSVHTYCGTLQSAARSIFESAVLLTVPYWRLARKNTTTKEFRFSFPN